MQSATCHPSIGTAKADALSAAALQRSGEPSAAQVRQAIAAAIRAYGARGCAARVAQVPADRRAADAPGPGTVPAARQAG